MATSTEDVMRQVAPYPGELADLVRTLRYRRHLGWRVWLDHDCQRDKPGRHSGESRGLTLIVQRSGTNTYDPDYFAVPAATYNRESWRRWLFDRLGDVDTHERMEDFAFEEDSPLAGRDGLTRPLAPVHKPGWDPYMITVVPATAEDRDTDFRGRRVHPETAPPEQDRSGGPDGMV